MKNLLLTLMIGFYSFGYTQAEYVKVTKYTNDRSALIDVKTTKGIIHFVIMETKHYKAKEARTKSDYQQHINVQDNDIYYLKKVFRIRDRSNLVKNYLLEFYESYDGKSLIKLIPVSRGLRLSPNWKKEQLMHCYSKGIKQTILT